MAVIDKNYELQELSALQKRVAFTDKALAERLIALRDQGFPLQALSTAIGKSVSQVSRIISQLRQAQSTAHPPRTEAITAMELVRRALRGEVSHDELVEKLKGWKYDPQYQTKGEWDDWESVDNSFDAVEFAYVSDLITDDDYDAIVDAAG